MTVRFGERDVRRAWARRQILDGEPGARTPADVASAVVGIQAQDMSAAAFGLRARTRGLLAGELEGAIDARSVVVTWSLRGTRHLHAASDVRWLLALLGPAFGRPGRRAEQVGIAGAVGDKAVTVLRQALESDGPLTRPQVKDRLAPHGVDSSGQAAIHVIRRAALEGLLCVVPRSRPGRDGEERYVLLDDWIPPGPAGDGEDGLMLLARRYLGAYAPASPADFAAWCGLGAGVARQAWRALASELVEVDGPLGSSWVRADQLDTVRADGGEPIPLRLLGGFDTLLLGHADRALLVPEEHAGRVNAGGGIIKPTVLADGAVIGTWTLRRGRRSHAIEVDPFRRMGASERSALGGEAEDIGRFLGTETRLTVSDEGRPSS